jgi:glycerol uptake facilitator protein
MPLKQLPVYLVAQFAGAFIATAVLYGLFSGSIAVYEVAHGIVRGAPDSLRPATMLGGFYPNPVAGGAVVVSLWGAFAAEALGTFLLVTMVFALTEGCNVGRPDEGLAPVLIGLTVTSVICLIAPLTQAGVRPGRDMGPRLFSWLADWGQPAFPADRRGPFWAYLLAPLLGGALA